MKHLRTQGGPFAERPYYQLDEIDRMCAEELYQAELYPNEPRPIRIERFIEKRFRVTPEYQDLDPGVLGYTRFGANGVEAIIVSRALGQDESPVAQRRANTTLAHEAGHALLHGHLFALEWKPSLFGEGVDRSKILCRDEATEPSHQRKASVRWWEFQANRAIGGFLMPRKLVVMSLAGIVEDRGIGGHVLRADRRLEAERWLAEVFDVNIAAARIRLNDLYPRGNEPQLTL